MEINERTIAWYRNDIADLLRNLTPDELHEMAVKIDEDIKTSERRDWRDNVNECIENLIYEAKEFLVALFGGVPDHKVLDDYKATLISLSNMIEKDRFEPEPEENKPWEGPTREEEDEIEIDNVLSNITKILDAMFNDK